MQFQDPADRIGGRVLFVLFYANRKLWRNKACCLRDSLGFKDSRWHSLIVLLHEIDLSWFFCNSEISGYVWFANMS